MRSATDRKDLRQPGFRVTRKPEVGPSQRVNHAGGDTRDAAVEAASCAQAGCYRDGSGGLAVVIAQDSAKALATGEAAFYATDVIGWLDDAVVEALMVPFSLIVLHVAMPKTACRGSSAIRGTPCFNSL